MLGLSGLLLLPTPSFARAGGGSGSQVTTDQEHPLVHQSGDIDASDLTAGSVIFSDGNNLTEDNANFNYQDSTNDLTVTGKHIFDSDSDSYLRYNTSTGVVELFVDGTKQVQWPIAGAAPIDIVLLETGDGILLENGVDSILLE